MVELQQQTLSIIFNFIEEASKTQLYQKCKSTLK